MRDVHGAVARRVFGLAGRLTGGAARGPARAHERISSAVYAGVGGGLRATSRGLRAADRHGLGGRIEDSPQGRLVVSVVNGFIGDRLAEQQSSLAIRLAVRHRGPRRTAGAGGAGRGVPRRHRRRRGLPARALARPRPTGTATPGETGGSYGTRLAAETSWTPVYLRANTGLPVAENGVALASLLDDLVAAWPTEVRRIALVGHSMGGLVMRAACAVATDATRPWTDLVTDVVTLGTPHLGAPLERGVALGAQVLGLLPESAPFGRILEYRSVGILDLRGGLAPDVQHLPHARYHLVAATLASSHRHPVSEAFGDLLVRYPSATGRPRRGREMFPGADVLHVKGGHFDLLNHPRVYDALRTWLG